MVEWGRGGWRLSNLSSIFFFLYSQRVKNGIYIFK
jgi:hypothetical protein